MPRHPSHNGHYHKRLDTKKNSVPAKLHELPGREEQQDYWREAIGEVQRCLDENLVIVYQQQFGADECMPEISCPECDERHWSNVISLIKRLASRHNWESEAVSSHGNKHRPHEPHSIAELRQWIGYLWTAIDLTDDRSSFA